MAAAETGSPSPAQAFRLDARPFGSDGQVEPRRRVAIRPGSRLGGRPASSRQSDKRFAAGPSCVADGESEVAQRGFVGVEAQDLGGGRGALQRQAGAQRPGGRRVAAQDRRRAARARRRRRTADRPALPFRSPAPRPDRRRRRKGLPFRGFRRVRFARARCRVRRGNALAGVAASGRRAGRGRRESPGAWCIVARRFVTCLGAYPPRLSWGGDVR